jgi:hypothetical protein
MVEMDCQTLFSTVKVKIQCKNPTKVPKARLFVFNKGVYVINFKTKGYVQEANSIGGDSLNGGVEELEEEDLSDGEIPDDNPKENAIGPQEDSNKEDKEKGGGDPPTIDQ